MSAWAAWATLGLYPLAGSDTFLLGSPSLATGADVVLPSSPASPTLSIRVHNASADNHYVALFLLNGQPVSVPYIKAADMLPARCGNTGKGGLLEFVMTDRPVEWGTGRVLDPAEVAAFPLPAWPVGLPQADDLRPRRTP